MSASKNPPTKIAKFRTFAQDAEKHANNSIDEVRATHSKPKESDPAQGQKKGQPEVVDLDNVDTSETTDDTTTGPIPKKPIPKNESGPESDTADTDTVEKDISNPPFHKLEAERKKAAEKISASSKTISNHPDSILSGDQKQTVQMEDDEATAGATIVTDTKVGRKSVLEDISDSVTGWFSDIKNTYITPPKPSYTVSKSERRAGILQDATPQTGADLVDHDSFAARIRERYQNTTVQDTAAVTEPAWLPSLPPSNKRSISEVKTVPRKSVQTPRAEAVSHDATAPAASAPAKTNESPVATKPLPVAKPATAPQEAPAAKEEATTKPAKEPKKDLPTKKSEPTPPPATAKPESHPVPKPASEPKTILATQKSTPLPQPPTVEPDKVDMAPAATEEKATKEPTSPEPETKKPEPAVTSNEAPKTESRPVATTTQPTSQVPVEPEEYVLPSDEEIDAEAMWADRQATNKLSLGIVLGTTVAVIAGIIVYSIAPLLLNQPANPATTAAAPFTGTVSTIAVNDWNDPLSRTQAVREAMGADIATLSYIALTNESNTITAPGTVAQLLTIEIPTSIQAAAHDLYVGNYRGTPFLYFYAPDTPQILGAMLAWETQLSTDLGPLLPVTDHSGTFVDMIIDDTYDARVKVADDNSTTMTYLLTNDHVLITTTPEVAAAILSSL